MSKPRCRLACTMSLSCPCCNLASGIKDEAGEYSTSIVEELRERERQLATLLANLPGLAYRCKNDPDWTMLFLSAGCYELTGYHPQDFLEKRVNYNDLIDESYRQYLWTRWQEVLVAGEPLTEEYVITTATGERKWVWEQGRGVYGPDGEVIALEGIIMNITDRKWAEASARHRLEELVYMSYHDKLTGLYNRAFLDGEMSRLDAAELVPISVIMSDVNGLKITNDVFGHQVGDQLLVAISDILRKACRPEDVIARWGGDEFVILLPGVDEEEAEEICAEIRSMISSLEKNPLVPSMSFGYATKVDKQTSLQQVLTLAEDRTFRRKLLESKSMRSAILDSLQQTLFRKSSETEEHGRRIAELCHRMGHVLNLPQTQHDEIRLLSLLHDIGKIGIQDSILQKPGPLSEAEWAEMKEHPEIGCRIAQSVYELAPIADYILSHHERWDGSGYPQGLRGEEIPLLARMLAVADAYDAMTQPRPYRAAVSHEEAVAEIVRCSGTQFDPKIVDAFLRVIEEN